MPSRTHTLGNGMRVVLHEDRSSPLVAVHLMYHVGSKNEAPGRTGLAHLLEHLLFEGTEQCPKGEFDRLLEAVGGTNNGSTWLDRTNYYETVPSHAVELALWLERERMAHFLPVLSEEMLEVQRSVVMNERRQTSENRPYGLADERLHELLFPDGHPYSWPTIGYMPDLEAITLADTRRFFEERYTPGNAVLVLAGDVGEESLELAERYFGDLPSGPAPKRIPALAPSTGAPTETMEDQVSFPRMYQGYSVPAYGTREWVALDVLAYVLADGESSRLQRALVREGQIAQDVDTYLYPTELSGIFGVVATARSGVPGEKLVEVTGDVMEEIARSGPTAGELAGALRRVRRDHVAGLSNLEDRAEELAYAATVLGGAEELERVWDLYLEVTPEEVQRAAAESLESAHSATLLVVPEED